ncbi:two-component sensor histidine kinase [Nonomuraea sp. KC401]|uniref:sensor histidine kinase n=1 Tax=unclassified Nonomuraea TaxID=2593643 RepID=UPI0010FE9662|nr:MULTISPECIES: histidine kinase [unclassified Nonomuraea]NBE97965.1 two-component sensor histidine kinase [Nonomuraea sp. K271]TLF57084.1 two-component sensor histidine kinase [Nonomuraea sp. KC401]
MFANVPGVVRSWPGSWRARSTFAKDGALAALLTSLAFVPTLSAISAQLGDLPGRPSDVPALALVLAQSAPLAVRRRWPAACLAVVGAAFAVHQALSYPPTFASIGLYLAVYAAGAHQALFRHGLAAAASAGYAALAVVLHDLGSPNRVQDFLAFYLMLVVVWLAGAGMRRRQAEEAERRRLAADVAKASERARIARELHDVVTHHVTAMVVQADAAGLVVGAAPDRAEAGLASIGDTGRRALTELRHLLGVLEATGEPGAADDRTPALVGIGELVEQARASGQPVELAEHGEPRPRPADVELAAYRVVQEALTNAVKHAAGRPTRVTVHHDPERIAIEVTSDGPAGAAPAVPSGGRGLEGLRRRLRTLDGDLVAAGGPGGGFSVRASIPASIPASVPASTSAGSRT